LRFQYSNEEELEHNSWFGVSTIEECDFGVEKELKIDRTLVMRRAINYGIRRRIIGTLLMFFKFVLFSFEILNLNLFIYFSIFVYKLKR